MKTRHRDILVLIRNEIIPEKAIEQIKTNTRQYSKRQMTWFKKDAAMRWFSPADVNKMIQFANKLTSS